MGAPFVVNAMEIKITCREKGESQGVYSALQKPDLESAFDRLETGENVSAGNDNGMFADSGQDDVTIWRWRVKNNSDEVWSGVVRLELHFEKENPRFFLPAFLYGRNKGEWPANVRWSYPRLREGKEEMPYSSWWMVRSDRLSHPAALVYDKGRVLGLSAAPYLEKKEGRLIAHEAGKRETFYQYAGFGCFLEEGFVAYTLGYENAPFLFVDASTIQERAALGENCLVLAPGEEVCLTVRVYDYEAQSPLDVQRALEDVYRQYHEAPRKGAGIRQAVQEISEAISKDSWRPEGKNYATQVHENEDGSLSYVDFFSISWTGGVEVAVPMLMAALRLDDEEMRGKALTCIQNVVEHSLNEASGLPYDAWADGKWNTRGWWYGHLHATGHASYLVGQAVFYILKGYEYEKRLKNIVHEDWLAFAGAVIEKMERTKNQDAEYPYIWSEETGAGLEYDAFSGAWCLACCAYYSFLTGDRSHLAGMRESEAHYYRAYLGRMECYGTPLDTDKAVDSEGILAYIKAVRYLHEITGEGIFRKHMREALGYEFSFKFCYNSPVKVPPLSKLGWSSCGGSVTSTCNPHIHPMSNNVVDEMLYYLEGGEDAYIISRLMDTVGWGCQTYNTCDKEYDYGKKGWMSERFCHSEGLLLEHYADGSPASTWFLLLPWGGSNIVEGMAGELWERMEKGTCGGKERIMPDE